MFKNIYYNTKRSVICLWENDCYKEIPWVPYVFINDPVNGESFNLNGDKVSKREFENYNEYYSFQKDNNNIYENKVRPDIQFLAENYHNIPDEDIETPNLRVYYLDIEVFFSDSFPHPLLADNPVTIISVRDGITQKTITFGCKEYTGNYEENENVDYRYYENENDLLRNFFGWINEHTCDVISGWNVGDFDLTYLINRDKNINDGKYYNLLSPVGIVKTWKSKNNSLNIDIAGVTIIDYLTTYKWYSPNKLESYKLDFVSNFELGVGKLDYSNSAIDLRSLYENDWDTYLEYNIIDCKRVNELEIKLGYIKLIQSLSLLSKAPMKYFDKTTFLVEGLMLTHARRNNLCVPYLAGGHQESFEAAYVKQPQVGRHKWLFSVDITSSYPSHIITLNMSTETYFGRITDISEDMVIKHMNEREFPSFTLNKPDCTVKMKGKKLDTFNNAIKKKILSVAPCGTIFHNNKPGFMAIVERNLFAKRKLVKKKMFNTKNKEEKGRLFSFQWAIKIVLNVVYGATSVPYSRYYNQDIAEAITSCGRYTVKSGERFANEIMNSPDKGLLNLIKKIKEKY